MDKTSQQLEVVSTGTAANGGRTLILLGHGSHLNADSAAAVRRHARAVRAQGLFDEVLEGSWKEEPSLRQLLRLARFRDVTVVPLFVSEGYFTGTVIPRELGFEWRGPVPPGA
ncbi:CbiX/SirB N-terminal domain-containing protein [Deinococcus radiodurans]|uniref:CbiX/SirB N-terminal domain-containing protein n=1 Tax=Deinococcus radiodurans TaxID=1299 RepID=UPI00312C72B0